MDYKAISPEDRERFQRLQMKFLEKLFSACHDETLGKLLSWYNINKLGLNVTDIAKLSHMDRRTVRRYRDKLLEKKWIKLEKNPYKPTIISDLGAVQINQIMQYMYDQYQNLWHSINNINRR